MTPIDKLNLFHRVTVANELYGPPIGFGDLSGRFAFSELLSMWHEQQANIATKKEASSAVYVHIPFCVNRRCTFCMYPSTTKYSERLLSQYLMRIHDEVSAWREAVSPCLPLHNIYVGGGTPNVYSAQQLEQLLLPIVKLGYSVDSERTCEISAATASIDQIKALSCLGFNRISIGVQSFNENVLSAVHRKMAQVAHVEKLIKKARSLNFIDVNVDLMVGLPCENEETIRHDIRTVVKMGALSVSLYSYRNTNKVMDWDTEELRQIKIKRLLSVAAEEMALAGWIYWAGDENTEFHLFLNPDRKIGTIRYKTSMNGIDNYQVVGLGAFAHGFMPSFYYTCESSPTVARISECRYSVGVLTPRQQMQTAICNMLVSRSMCIDKSLFKDAFGVAVVDVFDRELRELQELGKLNQTEEDAKIVSSSRIEAAVLQKFFWDYKYIDELDKGKM